MVVIHVAVLGAVWVRADGAGVVLNLLAGNDAVTRRVNQKGGIPWCCYSWGLEWVVCVGGVIVHLFAWKMGALCGRGGRAGDVYVRVHGCVRARVYAYTCMCVYGRTGLGVGGWGRT